MLSTPWALCTQRWLAKERAADRLGHPQHQHHQLSPSREDRAWVFEQIDKRDRLLVAAYRASLQRAIEAGDVRVLAFALLRAGVYQGARPLDEILQVSVHAVLEACLPGPRQIPGIQTVEEIILCAYTANGKKQRVRRALIHDNNTASKIRATKAVCFVCADRRQWRVMPTLLFIQ
jgi:hypothetical protein